MKRFFTSSLFIIFCCCKVNAAVFSVTSTGDGTGTGTLRWAITQANNTVAKDTITFAITGAGPHTILPGSNYEVILYPLVIDGYSQSGSVQGQLGTSTRVLKIIINGPGNSTVFGFQITSNDCIISGLALQDFNAGILINGGDNNWIWGCYIGTEVDGLTSTAASTCYDDGIRLTTNANTNRIGTNGDGSNDANEGNCIGGNGDGGAQYLGECIAINEGGTTANNCSGNIIAGNYLGINEAGSTALYFNPTADAQRGTGIHVTNSTLTIIGTNADGVSDALERNVISGNSDAGIVLQGSSSNKIKGNYIGSNKTGLIGVPNYSNGGIKIGTTQVAIKSTSLNNFLGTDGDGTNDNIEGNVIGSATIASGGASSYSDGIDITSSSTGNRVSGNYIGIGSDGVTVLSILTTGGSNIDYALYITAASNIVGTNGDGISDALESNYIGNSGTGLTIESAASNIVAGNYFGLGTNLTTSAPFTTAGVYLLSTTSTRVGSSALNSLESNYLCNSSKYGIWVDGGGTNNNDLINIRYNYVGIKPNSTAGSNAFMGIYVYNNSHGDTLQYNTVAYNGTASASGLYPGIQIGTTLTESKDNVIKFNTIYKNIGQGISIIKKESKGTTISQNSIYFNGNGSDATGKLKLGIDLEGDAVTLNDNKDPDDGANAYMNYPVITSGIKSSTSCTETVSGTLNAKANETFTIEVFSGNVCNGDTAGVDYYTTAGSNYGEGKTYLGSTTCTTNGSGIATWSLAVTAVGNYLTATSTMVTDGATAKSTSEFSQCFSFNADMGDAPDVYKTILANCGAIHMSINSNLIFGTTVDNEGDGQPSINADGDGADENGVSSIPTLTVKSTTYTMPVSVTNTTGNKAYIYAWIDLNANSAFQASELVIDSVTTSGTVIKNLTWNLSGYTCGANFNPGNTYMRLRLTTDSLVDNTSTSTIDERSYGIATNGEIEDYKIYIYGFDYGDLPATYPIATAMCLEDTATAKVWGGVTKPIRECTQNFSADAYGEGVEEDGLTTAIGPSGTSNNWVLKLNATQASKTVYYGIWIDWDGNANFTSGLDAFYSGSAVITGATNRSVLIYTPYGISNSAGIRVMISDTAVTTGMYNATIFNGEIEDYSLLRVLSAPSNLLMGNKQGTGNILKWKNAAGLKIKKYSVERSSDNLSWIDLDNVVPGLNDDVSKQYFYLDINPVNGKNNYRLKLYMHDGSYLYSNIVYLNGNKNESSLRVFPNPSKDVINIQTDNSIFNKYIITDVTGRVELNGAINSFNTPVDISLLSAGTHLVKLLSNYGTEEVQRFVKIK